jgi:hypothetical protein
MKAKIKTALGTIEVDVERGGFMFGGIRVAIVGDMLEVDASSLAKVPAFRMVDPSPAPAPYVAPEVVSAPAPAPVVASEPAAPKPRKGGRTASYDRARLFDTIVEGVKAGETDRAGVFAYVTAQGCKVTAQNVSDAFTVLIKKDRIVRVSRGQYAPVPAGLAWERVHALLESKGDAGCSSLRLFKDMGGEAKVGASRGALERKLNLWRKRGLVHKEGNAWCLTPPPSGESPTTKGGIDAVSG